ncbi:septum formation family protein [Aeromicrobium sp. Leaf350]|uniref:septum formation family protein n=1 Tax=Aeromicrobium sp. Leaf350 TaxID=2876565 RepID=UPI001E54C571|nr:septum formation family protein [Aeromicrobium sp. Leaf350]
MSTIPPPNPFAPAGQTSVVTPPPPPAPAGGPTPGAPGPTPAPLSRRELMAQLSSSRQKAGWALGIAITGIGGTVSLVLALIVLCGPRDGLRRGRGMAWASLVVLVAWSAFSVWAYFVVVQNTGIERNADGEITRGGEVDPTELRTGDCVSEDFEAAADTAADDVVDISTLTVVPCDELHNAQIIHTEELAAGPYPGLEAMFQRGEEICLAQFQPWVGTPYDASNLAVAPIVPYEEDWSRSRDVTCIAVSQDEVVGTFQGSNA